MKIIFAYFLVVGSTYSYGRIIGSLDNVLFNFKSLEFEKANNEIWQLQEGDLKHELSILSDLMYFAGQKDSSYFKLVSHSFDFSDTIIGCIQLLNKGYYELYYGKTKGEAFKYFHEAREISKSLKNKSLLKASLLALMQYYHFEIAQNSQDQQTYLQEFKELRSDKIDDVWIALYGLIYYSKTLETLDDAYFSLADKLGIYENMLPSNSKLLPKIYFEHGLRLELENKLEYAKQYFELAKQAAKDFPFLRETRFFSSIRLSGIAQKKGQFEEAVKLVNNAKDHLDISDTLRSNYYINLYSSLYYNDLKKYDTAYHLLNKAYKAGFYLDFRRNSLEINRLNVVLQTRQKELDNSRLRQNKIWLIVASSILGLLLLLSYLALQNIRSKKHIVEKEKEIQIQKVEKLIRDQELSGIDAMIEGQEKERQRLANELHDHLGSLLATVKYHIQNVRISRKQGGAGEEALLDKADDLLEQAYQKVRGIAHERNAGVPAQEGLLPAVKNFASKVSYNNRLKIDVIDHGMDKRLENSLELTLFRIIQELITNIIKHSGGKEASIQLTHHETSINVLVEDDGAGFEASAVPAGMGLYAIRKRIDSLAGTLTIDSAPGKGTTVIIDIPL